MADALQEVKRHFGPDAVILHTRTLERSTLLGIGKHSTVEITAARSMSDLPPGLRRGTLKGTSGLTKRAEGAAASMPKIATANRSDPNRDALVSEVGALRSVVNDLVRETRRTQCTSLPGRLYESYRSLVAQDVAEELAHQLVEAVRSELDESQLQDDACVRQAIARQMERLLPVSGAIHPLHRGRPTVIALVGPTGVGKTTTLAKLAANLCLREGRKVGLITIDTYRIAAVEQLKTYASIIDIPLEVVTAPAQMTDAVARLADRDVILVDTAGRSPRDVQKIGQLRDYFRVVKPDEVHLVLAGNCAADVLEETIENFRDVGVDRVLFTKLDEAVGFGVILACLQKARVRLSYVTTGQDVPDDIRVGESKDVVGLILGERTVDGQAVAETALRAEGPLATASG